MARTKNNPFRGVRNTYQAAETTVVVLTCIPCKEGYYAERFDVLKLCLSSILKNTDGSYDIMVVDNGSMKEVVNFLIDLKNKGLVQHLILNEKNLYLADALNMAFHAAPGKYIAYTDDDVFFYPNWLSKHLEILETFPMVGFVSGFVFDGDRYHDSVPRVAAEHNFSCGSFSVPGEWNEDYCESFGKDLEEFYNHSDVRDCENYLIKKDGVKAISGARDQTYVFKKELLKQIPPMKRGDFGRFACAMMWQKEAEDRGFMRLCTYGKSSAHIGNELSDKWRSKSSEFRVDVASKRNLKKNIVLANPLAQKAIKVVSRQLLKWVY